MHDITGAPDHPIVAAIGAKVGIPVPSMTMASSLGMEAAEADTLEACADLMTQSFRRPGPFLIELSI